jgi:hypothetical protein
MLDHQCFPNTQHPKSSLFHKDSADGSTLFDRTGVTNDGMSRWLISLIFINAFSNTNRFLPQIISQPVAYLAQSLVIWPTHGVSNRSKHVMHPPILISIYISDRTIVIGIGLLQIKLTYWYANPIPRLRLNRTVWIVYHI